MLQTETAPSTRPLSDQLPIGERIKPRNVAPKPADRVQSCSGVASDAAAAGFMATTL